MDILRRFTDGEYRTAYSLLLESGFHPDDFTVGTKGKTKVMLGEKSVTLIYKNSTEEMSYDSFNELAEKYNELHKLLKQKGFAKKETKIGIDIYENKSERALVGRKVKIIFGKTKEKLTYDEAIAVFTSY